jgi:MOSC domain-containing protein YiiM
MTAVHGILKQINRSNGGLPKRIIHGPVMLSEISVEGDRCRNLKYHGGPKQAVLMASAEFIDDLAARGFPVFYGAIGENVTVSGLDPHMWRAGQRYRIGQQATIELTKLRTPCVNLDVYGPAIKLELFDSLCKAGDIASPHWAHGGIYARVVRPGMIQAGDAVVLESDIA